MTSFKQIAANRPNPSKRASSAHAANALRHGLTSETVIGALVEVDRGHWRRVSANSEAAFFALNTRSAICSAKTIQVAD